MQVDLSGRVTDVFSPADGTDNLVTFADTEQGGTVKLWIPKTVNIKMDGLYNLHLALKPTYGQKGLLLQVKSIKNNSKEG